MQEEIGKIPRRSDKRLTFHAVFLAFNLYDFHVLQEGSKRFAFYVSKYFLDILMLPLASPVLNKKGTKKPTKPP